MDILYDVAGSRGTPTGIADQVVAYSDRCADDTRGFNASLLSCLPKKAACVDVDLGEFFIGECTRPFALVNTDNRIIVSASRITWGPILSNFIGPRPQGFRKFRQILVCPNTYESAMPELPGGV